MRLRRHRLVRADLDTPLGDIEALSSFQVNMTEGDIEVDFRPAHNEHSAYMLKLHRYDALDLRDDLCRLLGTPGIGRLWA